ncbi:MAG TPA: ABC transporter substrate-binding protein [Candidatus Acidoferrum sp.]|nr:ABC transporter substrate-binding protein [Candidatus Acidoferrum sp.]
MFDPRSFSRRRFVALAGAAALAPTAVRAQSRTLRFASAPDDDVTSFLYAQEAGIFKRAGLDVTIQRSNSGSAVAAAVAGGSIDIGKSSVMSLISAHNRGLPFVLVAPAGLYTAAEPVVAMLVAKEGPIRTPRDLAGKTIAVPALGDLYSIANNSFIDANGGDAKSVRYIEMPSAASPDAVINHRIDAVTLTTPILVAALETGKLRVIGHPFDAISKRFIQAAWFTTRDFAAQNREMIGRFQRAILESAVYANAHHAETVNALAAFTAADPKLVARMPRATAGTVLDPALVQPVIDAAVKYKAIAATFDARGMIDPGSLRS